MHVMQGVLLIVGVLVSMIALCAAVIGVERKYPSERYDERQKQSRGNAYRLSFWVGVLYYLVVTIVMIFQAETEKAVEPYLLIFSGLILQVMVLHFYCILTHCALPLSEKPWVSVVSYTVCGAFQILNRSYSQPLPFVGRESIVWVGLISGISFFALAILHLIGIFYREKE